MGIYKYNSRTVNGRTTRTFNASVGIFTILFSLFALGCWIGNFVKLVNDDWNFSKSNRAEIVHVIGAVVPPASLITVWIDDVKDAE